jgi:glycosyltransferase involved in cell wall biosynthesis
MTIRVVLISKACIVGAYQTKLEAIAAHDDVALTAVVPPSWRESGHEQRLEREHTAGYDLLVAPVAFNGRFHLHYYPGLERLLRRLRPDLVHIDEEPYNLATALALRAARKVGACSLFFTWQNLLRRYPWPFSTLERAAYRQVAAAIAGNQEATAVLRAKGYDGPVRLIPQFGVDAARFIPPSERPERPFTIGYAGRLVEQKGLWTLVEALAQLAGDWRFLCLGSGPLRQPLQERVRELGLAERVDWQERVSAGEMPEWYGRMDALVLPSLTRPNWKEQFGRVLIEAMACQTPVVGSDSGEIPHVIGRAGLVFPEGDAEELARQLALLQGDQEQRARLGRVGRERVLAHYTQTQIAAETVALYREVMAGPARGQDSQHKE